MPVNSAEQKFFEQIAAQNVANPPKLLSETSLEEFRSNCSAFLAFAGKAADISTNKDMTVPARDGYQIQVRIFNSDLPNNSPVFICYPGCGYILDLFELNAIAFSRVAKYSGIKVILVNFRLAPEHRLPGPIYDSYDATKYIALHASEFGINPEKIIIGGLSSGAHCAAAISNLARTDNSFKIYHQILFNGIYDLTRSNTDFSEYEQEDKLLTQEALIFQIQQHKLFAQDLKKSVNSPYFEDDLSRLPLTTIICAEYDAVRSDSEAYYQKLIQAGNPVEKIIIPGQTHNTIILREVMSDGPDPAEIIADVIKRYL